MSRKRRVLIGDTIGDTPRPLFIDIPTLVRTRLLVQANSGGGKSFFVRRLLEQTHGSVQQIVLDVEGEFSTLRQKFDYVLAAKGGDTPADPRGAALLAERLLELRISALVDLYELPHQDRIRFVKLFLDALVNAPKRLWHPALIVIDEAHLFCPQQGRKESPSATSVMDLCTRGRKRGFCAVLATQRLSKLHKDAAAECNNKLIGRTSMDVDMKRAGDELGFEKQDRLKLRTLRPGEFFAYGPAITKDVVAVHVGPVVTSHPKAGTSLRHRTAPPTRRVKKLLPKLADLPAEAEQRELTTKELKRQHAVDAQTIATLERRLKAHPDTIEKVVYRDRPILTRDQVKALSLALRRWNMAVVTAGTTMQAQMKIAEAIESTIGRRLQKFAVAGEPKGSTRAQTDATKPSGAIAGTARVPQSRPEAGAGAGLPIDITKDNAVTRVLTALAKMPDGAPAARVGSLSGVSAKRSTFRLAIMHLRRAGLVEGNASAYHLTPYGREITASIVSTPGDGAAAVEHWRKELGRGVARQMFDALSTAGEAGLPASELGAAAGVDPKVSTFRLGISRLRSLDLITGDREGFFLKPELLEHGTHDDRMVRSHGQSDSGHTKKRAW